ncbi:hypothetical protein M3X99_01015 [Clostridium perfringens]|uniref:hypothetical protein n=1 Tax=Clostridium perfringens TaxID=1502 RepID=UPI0023422462|nr:hypothetical protein [Clostridium perfringens]MDC4249591.1 hypothetical protein [Clostridium perfringens]
MDNIHNMIIDKINSYNYDKEVEEYAKALENDLEEGQLIKLFPKFDDGFVGNDEEDIAEKVSKRIISYKIREKALAKLMSKGIIYPVGVCDGFFSKRVIYRYGSRTLETSLDFRRLVFQNFMKL